MAIAPSQSERTPGPSTMLQIGAVNYLNSKPLIEGLPEHSLNCELVLDYPSRLADDLAAHRLDVALIPSVECLRHSDYVVISDACVAARGPVLSVKLYSRVAPGQIRTLALDEGSRTSAALVRTILAHKFAVEPDVAPLPLDLTELDTDADAVLLIGDRAMLPRREKFHTVWDLGEEWHRWTGLPFVFAVWAARAGLNGRTETLSAILSRARDRGLARLDQIAQREAPHLGISAALARSYLKHNLHFRLGAAERNGMRLFRQLAAEAGLIPGESDVVFSHSIHS